MFSLDKDTPELKSYDMQSFQRVVCRRLFRNPEDFEISTLAMMCRRVS